MAYHYIRELSVKKLVARLITKRHFFCALR